MEEREMEKEIQWDLQHTWALPKELEREMTQIPMVAILVATRMMGDVSSFHKNLMAAWMAGGWEPHRYVPPHVLYSYGIMKWLARVTEYEALFLSLIERHWEECADSLWKMNVKKDIIIYASKEKEQSSVQYGAGIRSGEPNSTSEDLARQRLL